MKTDGHTSPTRVRLGADERREQILKAALEAFHTKGYGQTSVRDLADSVGMSIAGMYHYFATKDDILFAILETSVDHLLSELTQARDSEETPEARIRAMLAAMIRVVVDDRASIRVLIDNADKLPPERAGMIRAKQRQGALMVRAELECLQKMGRLKPLDLNVITFAVNGMANWAYYWYDPDGPVDTVTLTEQFAEVFLHGVMK